MDAAILPEGPPALAKPARLADCDLTRRHWAHQTRTTSASWRSCGSTLSGEVAQLRRLFNVGQGHPGIVVKMSLWTGPLSLQACFWGPPGMQEPLYCSQANFNCRAGLEMPSVEVRWRDLTATAALPPRRGQSASYMRGLLQVWRRCRHPGRELMPWPRQYASGMPAACSQ